ncbi:hypothetical protein MesoLjLc_68110 [Mesorhizobium sp. L-8-10]|uniref:transposase n=1 Tax=Mesorhizobium sp. L-8-10 TaxID=2744523 RepID=UPI0019286E06|nr:transposase [Mesorhizobium sp. L-8-10]BCH34881.1 hypothetical protein MesoLjLc_68110 [Mesorhizobium sp. L-8-10]
MAKREAIGATFPQAAVLTCMVYLIGHLLDFVSQKDRKAVVPTLSYHLPGRGRQAGMKALEDFEAGDWAADTRRSLRAGGATGSTSCRSSPFRVCTASTVRRMRSKCPQRVGAISK